VSVHTYDCHVRFSDVDVYGHVNNVKYFEFYQEARIAFILSLDEPLFDPAQQDRMRQVVARIDVDYRRPILFRPEPYAVETWLTRIGTSSYDLACRIVDGDGTLYSRAEVRLVAFDTATQRSRPLSDAERSRLEAVLATAG
jgi:acyl-CoA thioester hydrolase